MTRHTHTYLALGDSYTIGESLPLYDSFPYQTVQLLRSKGLHFNAPEIVARTSWTTFELAEKLLHTKLSATYDFVTLLIGVNNQYRKLPIEDCKNDFEFLLKKAIQFSGEKPRHVLVLSLSDWGNTPYATKKNPVHISSEIAQFNAVNKDLANKYKTQYIDITKGAVAGKTDASLLADDGLHYSAIEYARWASLVAETIEKML
ncbi:MAG: SGNH/GDSL hydrolase family protein [Chitinophagaceae bacterium]|nr:SGNH/GDSL hydrolase family protein [Chitinophagaceae bacterium]